MLIRRTTVMLLAMAAGTVSAKDAEAMCRLAAEISAKVRNLIGETHPSLVPRAGKK